MTASAPAAPEFAKGLAGIVAGQTAICSLAGTLRYRGYDIEPLARAGDFEEVAWLLLRGELPTAAELAGLRQRVATAARSIPGPVLAALERAPGRDGEPREIETISDLKGLCRTHPMLGWPMVICCLSLLGLPPLLGFFGKLPLFTAAIRAGEIPLVLVLGVNSAIAACYYLKLAFAPLTEAADDADGDPILAAPFRTRAAAAVISCLCVVGLALGGNVLMQGARTAATYTDAAALKSRMPQAAAPAEADRGVAAQ